MKSIKTRKSQFTIRALAALGAVALICSQSTSFVPPMLAAPSAGVVISQVYGGGGNVGAPFTHDFVELFNRGGVPVSLAGWSIQYGSAAGNVGTLGLVTALPSITLQPGQYFLVQEGAGAGAGSPLPAPDVIASPAIAMSATAGKVALVNTTTGLGCGSATLTCSPTALAMIVDLVGYGGASLFEGTAPAPLLSNTIAASRDESGCTDTDDNAADFSAAGPSPRNTSSATTRI